jgi:opacity protein-like surface antigen
MKKITLSIIASMTMAGTLMAGGDIAPVEPSYDAAPVGQVMDYSGFYIGAGYSAQSSDVDDHSYNVNVDIDSDNMLFVAGYDYNKYIGIEGRYSFSVGDVELDDSNGYYESSDDYDTENWAIYIKPQYLMDNGFGVYALLGYGETEFSNLTETGDDSGFAWGIGAKYTVNNWSIFVDYTDLVNDGDLKGIEASPGVPADLDVDTDSWNFGVSYKF